MADCPTHGPYSVLRALSHTLSSYKAGGPGSNKVLSWREVDQGRKGSCLGQLSGDTGRFPRMPRMGRDPRVSGQGLVLAGSCSRCGEVWLRSEHQAQSHNSGRKQHRTAGPLLAPHLYPPLTSDCSLAFQCR